MIKSAAFKQIKISFSDEGKGRAIVLLHGFLEDKSIWKSFSAKLSKQYRVISIDLPGFGETPGIGYMHSMELMAESVKAVMDSIGLRRYLLVGHSMGGYVAMAFAWLYPQNISGICLFHSTAAADSAEKKEERSRVIDVVKKDPVIFIKNFFAKLFAPENVEPFSEKIEVLRKNADKISRQNIVNVLEGMKSRVDRRELLKKNTFPYLFIVGKKDAVVLPDLVLEQAKTAANATVLLLDNVGHMGYYEAEKECLKAIKRLATRCFNKK